MALLPRLRMLAGPNGSGKSSLVPQLLTAVSLGVSINADEIEASLLAQPDGLRLLNLHDWQLRLTDKDLRHFSALPGSQRLEAGALSQLRIDHNVLLFQQAAVDSYLAAWVAEFFRYSLLRIGQTMTFETVMSHPSKLEFLRDARQVGYRTYLYFVATKDPEINIARVKARVAKGGYPVAADKIIARYHRSLELAKPAIRIVDRAYLFDNSGVGPQLMAEITNGREVEYQADTVPEWVERVLN